MKMDELFWERLDKQGIDGNDEESWEHLQDGERDILELHYDLKSIFTPIIRPDFIRRLQAAVIEELVIPSLRIDFIPIILFIVIGTVIATIYWLMGDAFSSIPIPESWDTWLMTIMAISISGLGLLGLDLWMQKQSRKE